MDIFNIVDRVAEPAFLVNREHRIIAWNKACEKLVGYEARSVLGKPCFQVMRGTDVFGNRFCDKNCPVFNMCLHGERVNPFEVVLRTADSTTLRANLSIVVLRQASEFAIMHLVNPLGRGEERKARHDRKVSGRRSSAPDQLTLRETDALRQVAAGRSTHQIANGPVISGVIKQVLEQAAHSLEAPRVLMAWEEPDEPWLHQVLFSHGELYENRWPPGKFNSLVAASLEGKSFFSRDVRDLTAVVLDALPSDTRRWHGKPLNRELEKLFNVKSVLSVSVLGEKLKGRLFFLDKFSLTSKDLIMADVVAGQVAARLDACYLLRCLHQASALEERMRLSRDLHDGVLQSFAAVGLQLQAALQGFKESPETARGQLEGIQDIIVKEQRNLRSFIGELKLTLAPTGRDIDLENLLGQVIETVEQGWGLSVDLRVNGVDLGINGLEWRIPTLAHEIYHIVREGLVNAARHGKASAARVEFALEDRQLRINISDNGQGFPSRGYHDHVSIAATGFGPATIKGRVASLGGKLNIFSADSGSRLEVTLPLSARTM
jgi:signal transduction histidine kinase